MSERKQIVIVEESVVSSLIKDIFTFTLFGGLLFFNHKYLSGSTLIDVLFIICIILLLAGRASKDVFKGSKEDAIKWLERAKK